MKAGYIIDIVKINNLLFMDDLELEKTLAWSSESRHVVCKSLKGEKQLM